jgi:hypothetical protein
MSLCPEGKASAFPFLFNAVKNYPLQDMESVHQWFLFRIWNDKHIGADAFAVWIPDLADTRDLGKKSGGCWTLAIRSNHVRLQY